MAQLEKFEKGNFRSVKGIKKLKLGFYPYTYVRTVVMRTLLFKKEDYHKMLKMDFNEIAQYLQESSYKNEINSLASDYAGADLLEIALNRSLSECFKKLIAISSHELGIVIKKYLERYDIEDIKTIIRGKLTGTEKEIVLNSITAAGTLSYGYLMSLMEKETIKDVLTSFENSPDGLLTNGLKELEEKKSLVVLENSLDKNYYNNLIQFSSKLPKQGKLFKKFLLKEVEILDILTLFRLKRIGFDKDETKEYMILSGDKVKDSKMLNLAGAENIEQLSNTLSKTEYKNLIKKGIEDFNSTGSLITLETDLYKHLLKQSILLLHQHPLSVDVILGYMFAKDIETRNLKTIVKGKQLGLDEQFIESQLVF